MAVELGVKAVRIDQLVMPPLLGDFTVFEYIHVIRLLHRAKSMRNDNRGTAFKKVL